MTSEEKKNQGVDILEQNGMSASHTQGRLGHRHSVNSGLFLFAVIVLFAVKAQSGIGSIWAIDDSEKVLATTLNHPLELSDLNKVWDGASISLFGARNEVIGFQIIVEADAQGASAVDIRLDSLIAPHYTIANALRNPNDVRDYVGRRIEFFKAHYILVDTPTNALWIWPPLARPASQYLGPIPDALVPFELGTERGGAPFAIPSNRSQSIWCDIYIPKEAPPGTYVGVIKVLESSSVVRSVPVQLKVYNFELPDSTHFHNMFHTRAQTIAVKHGVPAYSPRYFEIEREYYKIAHRHRMDLEFGLTIEELKTHAKGYFTGEWYTSAYGYDGPGVGVGNTTYGIGVLESPDGLSSGFLNTEQSYRTASDKWVSWFEQNAPRTQIFKYVIDEPDSSQYPLIRERVSWLRNNPGPGHRLKTYCTVKIDPRLYGFIDFWSVRGPSGDNWGDGILTGYVTPKVQERKALGERVAIYNGWRPCYGTPQIIDAEAIDGRVIPWMAWKYGIDQYYLWYTNLYYQVVNKAVTFSPWGRNCQVYADGRVAWGDGTLFYPGEDKEYPEFDLGFAGPVASIRMKSWRRGQQDYEYLHLLKHISPARSFDSIIDYLVPIAFDEIIGQNSPAPWAQRGYSYERQRRIIADLIESDLGSQKPGIPRFSRPDVGVKIQTEHVELGWLPVSGATHFRLEGSFDSLFTSTILDTVTSGTRLVFGSLRAFQRYYFRVRAMNQAGVGSYSDPLVVETQEILKTDTGYYGLPQEYHLGQNFPNPFNPMTTIGIFLPNASVCTMKVFNTLGAEVATLMSGVYSAGPHTVAWDASGQSSGVYYCRLFAGGFIDTIRMVLIK